jgi:hypothetical protein
MQQGDLAMAEPANPMVAFSDHSAQLVERIASSGLRFKAAPDGPQAESIGVPVSSSPLKKHWSGMRTSKRTASSSRR